MFKLGFHRGLVFNVVIATVGFIQSLIHFRSKGLALWLVESQVHWEPRHRHTNQPCSHHAHHCHHQGLSGPTHMKCCDKEGQC